MAHRARLDQRSGKIKTIPQASKIGLRPIFVYRCKEPEIYSILKVMHIIIGLGNPGKKYDGTRHNIGFDIVDELARRHDLEWKEHKKFEAEVAEGAGFMLVKPLTFMNHSGKSATAILRFYQLLPRTILGTKKDSDLSAALLVIHDELDLPFGTNKISTNSRAAGHNGIKSLIQHLKTQNFTRLRVGIGADNRRQMPTDKFVLQPFTPEEKQRLPEIIEEAVHVTEGKL